MRPSDQALTNALDKGERSAAHATRLGGVDMAAQVQAWSLDRAYGSDLPDAMRAFSGVASAQLDVTLSGTAGQSAPALYGPWAPRATGDVARPGQTVTHGWGINGSRLDAFRGTVRSRSAESGADAVKLVALDGSERLRMRAQLPRPSGGLDPRTPYGSGTNWVASPEWCVDHLLRRAGIHTAPPPRAGCIFYASLHGGAAADIGYLTSLSGDWSEWTRTAPHEIALQGSHGGSMAEYAPAVRAVTRNSPGLYYEVWADNTEILSPQQQIECTLVWDATPAAPIYTSIVLDLVRGALVLSSGLSAVPAGNASLTWTDDDIPKRNGRWHVGFWFTIDVDGESRFQPVVTGPGDVKYFTDYAPGTGMKIPPGSLRSIRLGVSSVRAEAMQVSQLSSRPTGDTGTQKGLWQKGATLDQPDIPLRVIPAVSGSAWDAITQIAKSTLSTASFDSDGVFHWRNRSRWRDAPTREDLVITAQRELAALTVTEEIDACRNHVAVQWADWSRITINTANAKNAINIVRIPKGGSAAIAWTVGDEEFDTPPPLPALKVGVGQIRFSTEDSDSAPTVLGTVEVGTHRENGAVVLTMLNRSPYAVWLRGTTDRDLSVSLSTPSMDTGAQTSTHRVAVEDKASQKAYGAQEYEHNPAGWIQDASSARGIANSLLAAGAYPVPLLGNVDILPDPRIELGDVVRVRDSTGAALDTLAWVVGIRTAAEGGAIRQTLTLRGTQYNGVPKDAGLTPDPPIRPGAT